jgi:hypothetical protein
VRYEKLWTVYPWEEEAKEAGYYNEELDKLIHGAGGFNLDRIRTYISGSALIKEKIDHLKGSV